MEKLEPSYTVGGKVKYCSCYGQQLGYSSKKINIEFLHGLAIQVLGVYARKLQPGFQRIICIQVLKAALFL